MFSESNGDTVETNRGMKLMTDILLTYVVYNSELEYVQGMSDLLGPLIAIFNDEVVSFWCFVGLMGRAVSLLCLLRILTSDIPWLRKRTF
jgi:hypothetical protein